MEELKGLVRELLGEGFLIAIEKHINSKIPCTVFVHLS